MLGDRAVLVGVGRSPRTTEEQQRRFGRQSLLARRQGNHGDKQPLINVETPAGTTTATSFRLSKAGTSPATAMLKRYRVAASTVATVLPVRFSKTVSRSATTELSYKRHLVGASSTATAKSLRALP